MGCFEYSFLGLVSKSSSCHYFFPFLCQKLFCYPPPPLCAVPPCLAVAESHRWQLNQMITLQFSYVSRCYLSTNLLHDWFSWSNIFSLHLVVFGRSLRMLMQLWVNFQRYPAIPCFCSVPLKVAAPRLCVQMSSLCGRYVHYEICRSKKSSFGKTASSGCCQRLT